jgi:hypothetical protein
MAYYYLASTNSIYSDPAPAGAIPITDATQAALAAAVLAGATLQADANGNPTTVIPTPTVAQIQARVQSAAAATYVGGCNVTLNGTGYWFQTDAISRVRYLMLISAGTTDGDWICMDGSAVSISPATMQQVVDAIVANDAAIDAAIPTATAANLTTTSTTAAGAVTTVTAVVATPNVAASFPQTYKQSITAVTATPPTLSTTTHV